MKLKSYVRKKIYTINLHENYTILELANVMLSNNEESVIIKDENHKPIYIITNSDLIHYFISKFENYTIKEIMEKFPKKLITSNENDDIYKVYKIMRKLKIEHIIVVDKEEKLIGAVLYSDLVMKFVETSLKDELTGLNNRRFLDSVLARYQNTNIEIGFIFIDIDNFKSINDNYGHKKGDEVISKVGEAILSSTREVDFSFRYGGDEFLVMIMNENKNIIMKVVDRLFKKLSQIEIVDNKLLSVSLGIAIYPDDDKDIHQVIKKADSSLYVVKSSGKGDYRYDNN